ncbi:hypothetical protein LCGC14_2745110, partial [marine sediment metagenome]
ARLPVSIPALPSHNYLVGQVEARVGSFRESAVGGMISGCGV